MKKLILAAVAVVAVAVLGIGSLTAPTTHANPAKIWVVNQNVVNSSAAAASCAAPGACDLTALADRQALASSFDAIQTASAGQVAQTAPIAAFSGSDTILVQSDGSGTNVTLNGRGLTCVPACDGVATAAPDPTDHIAVFAVTDAGVHSLNDTFVVTATEDAVTLDSGTLTVVGQAHDIQLTSVKTTIQEGLSACAITDDTSNPARSAAVTTYTDINGVDLVGYKTTWASSSANMKVSTLTTTTSQLLTDGTTTAAYQVICGVTAGSANLTSKNATANAISGITGSVTRTQAITITGVPAAIALTADPATIACDGTATSTVTAKVTDSAGNNVVDNTGVIFNVVALGTANPIQAKTTGGSASSTITPLSANVAGTTVVVQSGDVQASIRIDCLQPTPTVPAGPVATPTKTGGIVGPNTGTGGYLGQGSTGSFPMWTLIALAMGSVALVAGGMVTRRAGK